MSKKSTKEVVPISTAQCEHRFSTQNHIKERSRTV